MAADIYLAFGADTGQLEASLAAAQAAVKQTTAEMRSLASEMVKTGAATDSELGNRLAELGSRLADAKEHVSSFKEELKGTEGEGFIGGMVEKVKDFLAPLNSVKLGLSEMTEALAAAFAVEKVVEFIRSMGELGETTERTAAILGTTAEEVGVLNYSMALTGTATDNLNRLMGRFELGLEKAADGTGPVAAGLQALGLSAQELIGLSPEKQLEKIAEAVSKLADTPTKTAAVQALGRGFVELIPYLDQGAAGLERLHAQAEAAGVVLSEGLTKQLAEMQHGMTDLGQSIEGDAITAFAPFIEDVDVAVTGMRSLTQAFQDSAQQGGAVAQIIFLISDSLRILEEAIAIVVHAMELMFQAAKLMFQPILDLIKATAAEFSGLWADIKSGDVTFTHMHQAAAEAGAQMQKNFETNFAALHGDLDALGQDFKDLFKTVVDSSKDAGDRMREALHPEVPEAGAAKPAAAAIDDSPWGKATREVEALTVALQANKDALEGKKGLSYNLSDSDRDRIIRTIYGEAGNQGAEGQQAVADVIRNRAVSGKYGSSIDEVTKPSQFSAWEDSRTLPAMQALSKDSSAYKSIGEQVDKVFSGAVSDITKGASNYYAPGGMPGGKAPSWAAVTEAQNLVTIGGHRFSGKTEGLPAEPTGEAPTGAERDKLLEKQKELNLELDKAKQKLIDIKTEEAGGTETAKTKLAIDEADAKQKGDAVENAKKMLEAAKADQAAGAGGTDEKKAKLATEVAKAEEAVNAAILKQTETEGKLAAEKAKVSGDTEKEKAAEIAVADAKIKAAGADKAAVAAAEAEKLSIEQKYADQSKSLAMQKAQEEIAAAHTAAQNKIKDYDLEFRAKQISESQKVALTKAALADELAAEKSIYAQELALDNLRPAERQKILSELQAAETKYAQQVKETQIKAAEDAQKAWKSMADTVAGALNSQVSGLLSGTTTMKQAFSNMAKSMTEDAIKFAVKWVTEHAFAATANIAQNSAVTASSVAGDAAMTASKTASAGAGIATQAAAATSSIAIDGAKTFGGVFGFLAPLLGPFAAGPAAGAQATVLAAGAAFDTGAWSLPRDMIAAVHQGEMVIPSRGGVADEFRNFMSAGGFDRMGRGDAQPAGGSKSVSVNPAVHFHVNANDSQSVGQFFQNNHKHIMTAVDRAVRHGSALGLRSFTP